MMEVFLLFALTFPLVSSIDMCEDIELVNATAVCCEKNTTLPVGQDDVSLAPFRNYICPVGDVEIKSFVVNLF